MLRFLEVPNKGSLITSKKHAGNNGSSYNHFGLFEPCHTGLGQSTLPDIVDETLQDTCKLSMTRLFRCDFTGMSYLWGWRRPHTDISGLTESSGGMPSFTPELARSKCRQSNLVVYKTVASFGRSM